MAPVSTFAALHNRALVNRLLAAHLHDPWGDIVERLAQRLRIHAVVAAPISHRVA